MGTSLSTIAEQVWPSVVQVRPDAPGGAGIVLARGRELVVVTNAHVAQGRPGDRIRVASQGRVIYPTVIERIDAERDLALLAFHPRLVGTASDLSAATVGDVSTLRPGHLLIAVGHPFGLANAVTAGVVQWVGPVSALPEAGNGRRKLSWIQADIRLAPGNSGGPLCDIQGRVIGINTMVAGGLALAIPIGEVRDLLQGGMEEAVPA